MGDKLVTTERVGINDEIVQITFGEGAESSSSLPIIEQTFQNHFERNDVQLIVNMANIKLPPTKFIALLIEATNQARRLGGDVKLINVSNSTKSNFVTFSAITYLSIEDSEEYALCEFDENANFIQPINKTPIESHNSVIDLNHSSSKSKPVQFKEEIKTLSKSKSLLISESLQTNKIKVKSKIDCLYEICDFVTDLAKKIGFDEREISKIKVTVYEACLNVIEHAYFSNPDNWIEVNVKYNKEKLIIIIHDWGQGFEFDYAKKYDVEQAVKDRKTGGFGIHIIKRSVDEVEYESDPQLGNRLILTKYINNENVLIK